VRLYISKQTFDTPIDVLKMLEERGYKVLIWSNTEVVFNWKGRLTQIYVSVGVLGEARKIKVYVFDFPPTGVREEWHAERLGILFEREFFGREDSVIKVYGTKTFITEFIRGNLGWDTEMEERNEEIVWRTLGGFIVRYDRKKELIIVEAR